VTSVKKTAAQLWLPKKNVFRPQKFLEFGIAIDVCFTQTCLSAGHRFVCRVKITFILLLTNRFVWQIRCNALYTGFYWEFAFVRVIPNPTLMNSWINQPWAGPEHCCLPHWCTHGTQACALHTHAPSICLRAATCSVASPRMVFNCIVVWHTGGERKSEKEPSSLHFTANWYHVTPRVTGSSLRYVNGVGEHLFTMFLHIIIFEYNTRYCSWVAPQCGHWVKEPVFHGSEGIRFNGTQQETANRQLVQALEFTRSWQVRFVDMYVEFCWCVCCIHYLCLCCIDVYDSIISNPMILFVSLKKGSARTGRGISGLNERCI